ncbi:hypothetical protein [[Clostridium] scindens]|uniref:hypothetical protein n=1 Tax=Clostridium scindens (strain JCM 10418 / VPI 12708) TaxID=29347 RepID=UPI00241E4580|nr:hypothetical protein [[Clostridium] scindens]
MSKTDKELAIEVTCAYINAWFQRDVTPPLQGKDVTSIIESTYQAIKSLDAKTE